MAANVTTEGLFGGLALDVFELPLLSFLEKGVFEHQIVIVLFDFMKVIHIKLNEMKENLADKAGEVTMSEVFWQNFAGKCHDVLDHKTNTIFFPANHVLKLGVLT